MTKIYGWLAGALILLSGCSTTPPPLPIPQTTLKGQVHQMQNRRDSNDSTGRPVDDDYPHR